MKYRNMLPFVALSVLILTSCDDNKMEWYKDLHMERLLLPNCLCSWLKRFPVTSR